MYRGNVKFAEMGDMSPEILALARSRDLIGWQNFMEGSISKSFYEIQSCYLADAQSYMNGYDWTKKFISKILQITHSQWIYRNMSFHNEEVGYRRQKEMKAIKFEAERWSIQILLSCLKRADSYSKWMELRIQIRSLLIMT